MGTSKSYSLYKGYNFRVLRVDGFESICFGCPPGIVKDFGQRAQALPSQYVLPVRTFVQGKNHFDFEFIVYTFLFARPAHEKITIYCTSDQRARFKAILQETLFGPTLKNMIRAQFNKFGREAGFTDAESVRFDRFVDKLADSRKPFYLYRRLLKQNASERTLQSEMRGYFETQVRGKKWLLNKMHSRSISQFARNYTVCAQLKIEMELFSLARENKQKEFVDLLVDFKIFNRNKSVAVKGKGKKTLNIVQDRPSEFNIYMQSRKLCSLDMLKLDPPPRAGEIRPIERPFMGVTYLGVGSGFSHNRHNSCLIVWSEGKGIMVDAFNDNNVTTLKYGITERDIEYIILSHIHSDHDAGLIEMILSGQRVKIITTRIIFESFLRKVQGISRFPIQVIEEFIDFLEVDVGQKISLPGFKNTRMEFDYSLHSIPTLRFKVIYRTPGGKEKIITHSGDTKYDEDLAYRWWEMGNFSRKRRDSVLGFVWDGDLIIQEVGGGNLHTELGSLTHLESDLAKKVVLVHQHKDPFNHPYFRFAREGTTDVLIKNRKARIKSKLNMVRDMVLFQEVKPSQITEIVDQSKVVRLKPGTTVFSKNEIGDSFYVILDGFAEICLNQKKSVVYQKGMFFGELAVSTDNPRRRATVRTLSDTILLKIPKKFYQQSNLPIILDEFYFISNYFNNIVQSGLVASLGFGDLRYWHKRDRIFSDGFREDQVFVIISGEVKICPRDTKNVAFLSSGDIMGKIPYWKHLPLVEQTVAHSERVLAVGISTDELDQLFRLYPSFYGTVYQKMKRLESLLV